MILWIPCWLWKNPRFPSLFNTNGMCPIRQKNEERKELEANKTTSHEKQEANKLAKNDFSNSPKPTTTRFEEFLKLADIMTLLLIFSPSLFTPSWILRRSSAQYYSNKQSQEGQPRVELVHSTGGDVIKPASSAYPPLSSPAWQAVAGIHFVSWYYFIIATVYGSRMPFK